MAHERATEIDIHNHVVRTAFQAFPRTVYQADSRPEKNWTVDHPGFITREVVDEADLEDALEDGWKLTHIDPIVPKAKRARGAAAVATSAPAAAAEASSEAAPTGRATRSRARAKK